MPRASYVLDAATAVAAGARMVRIIIVLLPDSNKSDVDDVCHVPGHVHSRIQQQASSAKLHQPRVRVAESPETVATAKGRSGARVGRGVGVDEYLVGG